MMQYIPDWIKLNIGTLTIIFIILLVIPTAYILICLTIKFCKFIKHLKSQKRKENELLDTLSDKEMLGNIYEFIKQIQGENPDYPIFNEFKKIIADLKNDLFCEDNAFLKCRECFGNLLAENVKLKEKIKEQETLIKQMGEQTAKLSELEIVLKEKNNELTNLGIGIRDTLKYVDTVCGFVQDNPENITDIETMISDTNTYLLNMIPEFTPLENDVFEAGSMEISGETYGEYVKVTVEPGKKLGNCIIKKAKVERKETKE